MLLSNPSFSSLTVFPYLAVEEPTEDDLAASLDFGKKKKKKKSKSKEGEEDGGDEENANEDDDLNLVGSYIGMYCRD